MGKHTMILRADTLIVDGRHLLWRAADVHRDLSVNIDGVDVATGGVYGFLSVLIRVHTRYGGRVFISWEGQGDMREPNFRFGLYPGYKKKDTDLPSEQIEMISEIVGQESILKLILSAIGVKQYMGVGCEGDDVTGRLAREASGDGKVVAIYSGDGDLHQLLTIPGVYVVSPNIARHGGQAMDRIYDCASATKKHGVAPDLLAQLKALIGGKDNLPGVRGVGPKYGTALLKHYGSLDCVLRAAINEDEDWPLTPRIRGLVAASALDVITYYKVAKIRTNMPMESIPPNRSQKMVMDYLRKYRFQSLATSAELLALMALGRY